MRPQNYQIQPTKLSISNRQIIFPFIIQKPPLENYIAYQKKGHWTEKEKLKYAIFLQFFRQKFMSKDAKKRFCKIFKVMSDFIKTRTHNQCRSHHQKMEKQRFQVDSIIKNVASKYHPRVYQQLYEKYTLQIEHLMIESDYDQIQKLKQLRQNRIYPNDNKNQRKSLQKKLVMERQSLEQKWKSLEFGESININVQLNRPTVKQQNSPINKNSFKPTQNFSDKQSQDCPVRQQKKHQNQKDFFKNQFNLGKSLDYRFQNTYLQPKYSKQRIDNLRIMSHLQSLEMKRLQSLNRATYHYNQMQIQLQNASDCQHLKLMVETDQTMGFQGRNNFELQENHFGHSYLNQVRPFPNNYI